MLIVTYVSIPYFKNNKNHNNVSRYIGPVMGSQYFCGSKICDFLVKKCEQNEHVHFLIIVRPFLVSTNHGSRTVSIILSHHRPN